MLTTIIKKEILEAIFSLRFLIATLLCLVLIPLGMYVNLKEYEQRLADYQEAVRLYEQRLEGDKERKNLLAMFQAEGYRPPSVLSIFSIGLEYFLPNKVLTSREGAIHLTNESGVNNPQSLLFGKVDLLFNVNFVISLLALIFTFNAIAGEKEDGTLRLMMSNPAPRWQILLAKMIGNYVVLLVPFLLSILVALIVLSTSGIVPIFAKNIFSAFLIILFVTLLFILSIFNLGILVSTLTHRSVTSLVALLFIWSVLVLSLPKISPMLAEILHPVKSQQVNELQKLLVRQNLIKELDGKRRELYDQCAIAHGVQPIGIFPPGRTDAEKKMLTAYEEGKQALEQQYEQHINVEIRKLEQEYENQRNTQAAIAMNLSRLSPVSCYSYICSEISQTGVLEMHNFVDHAKRFQAEVKENIYNKFIIKIWVGTSGRGATSVDRAEGFDPEKVAVPQLNYQHTALSKALQAEWVDIVLLFLFNVVFFAASYVGFLRYDVR